MKKENVLIKTIIFESILISIKYMPGYILISLFLSEKCNIPFFILFFIFLSIIGYHTSHAYNIEKLEKRCDILENKISALNDCIKNELPILTDDIKNNIAIETSILKNIILDIQSNIKKQITED